MDRPPSPPLPASAPFALRVDPGLPTPPSRQIVEAVLDALAAGRLLPGDRLPSVRGLAAEALVNPNTVGKAYRDLEGLGVLAARMGDGVFVTLQGPATARRERQAATLDAVRAAVLAALRAGHEAEVVQHEIERALEAARPAPRASSGGVLR